MPSTFPELVEYARQRNVGIVLWADYHPFDQNMEAVVSTYSKMGIKGFKIDHINRNDQKAIDFAWRAASMCAKYHMIIDFHGVFPPNGLQFTYPNVLNFEAVLGLETVKWTKKYDGVTHECTVPFIRQVVGPIDYTQGAMRNATQSNYAPCNSSPMSQGTRCRQLAEYVIFESPFNMLCDSPTNYEVNQPCTDFIAKVPTVWDETRVLSARVGEYVIEARRKGGVWYIGGITNWTPRDITLDLSFIKAGKIVLYRDGVNADRNAEDYCVENLPFNGSLKVHLAPGGGFAGIIK
jgi:alpha-glucosidase